MKKMISVCMAALMLSAFAGCSSTTTSSESSYGGGTENSSASAQSSQAEANFDTSKDIAVISREDGDVYKRQVFRSNTRMGCFSGDGRCDFHMPGCLIDNGANIALIVKNHRMMGLKLGIIQIFSTQ